MSTLPAAPLDAIPSPAKRPRILLVDDDHAVRTTLARVLERSNFEVVPASNVPDALKLIVSQTFDALLSDLHIPCVGDGLTVVSAMRHAQPKAVTLIFSGHPAMKESANALLLHADGVLLKPMAPDALVKTLKDWLMTGATPRLGTESVASILERQTDSTIQDWLALVEAEPEVISVWIDGPSRTSHLPQLFRDLVQRLRVPLPLGSRALVSEGAKAHGLSRRKQGYSAAMLVEESRMLQVSIFKTLQSALPTVDYNVLLGDVMTIADEVDSQLAQAMACYILKSKSDGLPEATKA